MVWQNFWIIVRISPKGTTTLIVVVSAFL